uniref:Uncharacterized protein n=1 Tax=Helicotheca tamesis TaxID=374047 RepID=A0A7S2HY27_9STRA
MTITQNAECLRRVSFSPTLVTSVAYRPRTERLDCRTLFYSRSDIQEFRTEYERVNLMNRLKVERRRTVRFATCVVTCVQPIPSRSNLTRGEMKAMYYTSGELECFLNEYVTSMAMGVDDASDESTNDMCGCSEISMNTAQVSPKANEAKRSDASRTEERRCVSEATVERLPYPPKETSAIPMQRMRQRKETVSVQRSRPVIRRSCRQVSSDMRSRRIPSLSKNSQHMAMAA